MARRARIIATYDAAADCAVLSAPTLVVTGEAGLDHVVDVDGSSRYARLIAGSSYWVMTGTGHQGTLTRPDVFVDRVLAFVGSVVSEGVGRPSVATPTAGRVA
jgi:pimeloyl-ACP methyl ester carboxylesterase